MPDTIIYLDPDSPLNLQNQIRQKLVDGVLSGALPPGHKLPSSRKLARQLDVARNTVVLAYQQLVAEGYLVSRARSGIFVNEQMLESRVSYSDDRAPEIKAVHVGSQWYYGGDVSERHHLLLFFRQLRFPLAKCKGDGAQDQATMLTC